MLPALDPALLAGRASGFQRALGALLVQVVAAVGQDIERLDAHGGLRLARHVRELITVVADIGDVVGDDQVVLRIDGGLHIVADDGGSLAAVFSMARVRIRSARS